MPCPLHAFRRMYVGMALSRMIAMIAGCALQEPSAWSCMTGAVELRSVTHAHSWAPFQVGICSCLFMSESLRVLLGCNHVITIVDYLQYVLLHVAIASHWRWAITPIMMCHYNTCVVQCHYNSCVVEYLVKFCMPLRVTMHAARCVSTIKKISLCISSEHRSMSGMLMKLSSLCCSNSNRCNRSFDSFDADMTAHMQGSQHPKLQKLRLHLFKLEWYRED